MRLLLDQDVYASTAAFLTDSGHDVLRAAEAGLSRASDEELLRASQEQNRLLVTRDRDYGNLVFLKSLGAAVVYLRLRPSTQMAVHEGLGRVLEAYSQDELAKAFVVVEPGRHRFRRVPP